MIDIVSDRSRTHYQEIERSFQVPDFVKEALDSLPSDHVSYEPYADPANRLYRCDSKAGTWLSAAYFSKYGGQYKNSVLRQAVKLRIKKFADLWGVDWPDEQMFDKRASASYEVSIIDDTGQERQKVAIHCQKDADEFVDQFLASRPNFTYLMCRKVARRLLGMPKKIAVLGDNVNQLQKMAGFGMTTAQDMVQKLQKRALLVAHTEYGGRYESMAKLAATAVVTPKWLHKMAMIMDLADRGANIHRWYGDHVPPPEDILFRMTEKSAAQLKSSLFTLTNDHIYPKSLILKNAEEVQTWLSNYIGQEWDADPSQSEEFVDAIRQLPPKVANDMVDFLQGLQRRNPGARATIY